MKLPAKFPDQSMTVLIDTREQLPYRFPACSIRFCTLPTGDYSVAGLESHVAVERKSLEDLVQSCGRGRKRFDRELDRLRSYRVRGLVIEGSWQDIEEGEWRGKMTSRQVGSSLISFVARGIPVIMAGDRRRGEHLTYSLLRRAAIHEYERIRTFAGSL